jgi:uncharacterized protein
LKALDNFTLYFYHYLDNFTLRFYQATMKKYIFRANETLIFESFERPFVSALLGPRRVGKTTLINHYIQMHSDRVWVLLNMDNLSQRTSVAREELEMMIERAAFQKIGGGKKIWVFIDEAQKSPELFDQIKILYDTHKGTDQIKFVLTGSAHLNLHNLSAESLAGRVELLTLREFNLWEMAQLQNPQLVLPDDALFNLIFLSQDIESLNSRYRELRPYETVFSKSLSNHLIWGGLPETIEEPSEQLRLKYLGDYLQTYLEKDVRAIRTISDLQLYQNLMKVCAELTGSLQDDTKMMEALHCSRNTLIKYRQYLLATLQYMELFPFIRSSLKRLVKSPKGYIINNGLVSYLTGLHEFEILRTSGAIGHRFETWFLNEMLTWLDAQQVRTQIGFFRTSGGAEIDFIVEVGKTFIPFEVTYSATIDVKKRRNLEAFMKEYPSVPVGVFCYTGPFSYDSRTRILYIPAWML